MQASGTRRAVVLVLLVASIALLVPGLFLPVLTIRGVLTKDGIARMAPQILERGLDDATVNTLTSMLKRVDVAVKDISEKAMNGEFPGGEVITYGIPEDGVALADSRGAIPEDVMAQIDEYKEKIASGEIEVKEYPEGKEPK